MNRHTLVVSLMICVCGSVEPAWCEDDLTLRLPEDDPIKNTGLSSVAFSPDGRWLVAGYGAFAGFNGPQRPGQTVVWDLQNGKRQATLLGHKDGVRAVAYSPDGKFIATGGADGMVKLWTVATGEEKATMSVPRALINSLDFSPDGKTLAAGVWMVTSDIQPREGNDVWLWDVATGKELKRLKHREGVVAVAFSPDGKLLGVGTMDGHATLWNTRTAKVQAALTFPSADEYSTPWIHSVAFSPDGKTFAAVSGGSGGTESREIRFWDIQKAVEKPALPFHKAARGQVHIAFSPDGRFLVSADLCTAKIWDLTTSELLSTLMANEPVAFSPDGTKLGLGDDSDGFRVIDVAAALDRGPVLVGERFLAKSLFYSDARLQSITDIAHGEYDAAAGTEIAIAGLRGAVFLDQESRVKSKVRFSQPTANVNLIDIDGDHVCEFLDRGGEGWVDPSLFDHSGALLWQYTGASGVHDTAGGDVDGDGFFEFVVAGRDEIQLLDRHGKKKWQQPSSLPSHVELADVDNDGKPEIIHSGGRPHKLTIRNEQGAVIRKLSPPPDITDFSLCRWPTKDSDQRVLVEDYDTVWLFDFDGKTVAKFEKVRTDRLGDARGTLVEFVKGEPPYLAVLIDYSFRDRSLLYVYDSAGKIRYHEFFDDSYKSLEAIKLSDSGPDILLIGGDGEVWKYQATPQGLGR